MTRLTYVASGCGYTRINFPDVAKDPELCSRVNEILSIANNTYENHGFALLYNAFVEAKFGLQFQLFKDSVEFIEADSGGLQMVTRGMNITDDKKDGIYKNQGLYSNYAMCFDEIPLKFSGEKSSRLDMSNRWFDKELFEACARKTGQNIRRQIEMFIEMKSASKPILITQGNCYDTYMKWADLVLGEIPEENLKYIGGVAMGAAALGHGTLEDIRRAFYYTQLPNDLLNIRHMHLLAVGSLPRLLPNLVFIRSGVYDKDLHLTYDSTTHTSGIHQGRFYSDKKTIEFPREFDRKIWTEIYESMVDYTGIDITLEHFHELMNINSTEYLEKYGNKNKFVETYIAMTVTSVNNFRKHVNLCLKKKSELLGVMDRKGTHSAFESLYEVRTLDDFRHWEDEVGRFLPSSPVRNSAPSSLESFW